MKTHALMLALALAPIAQPAAAQSFLERMAKEAARRAAEGVAQRAADKLQSTAAGALAGGQARTHSQPASSEARHTPYGPTAMDQGRAIPPRPREEAASAATTGPTPWPVNTGADITYPNGLQFSPGTMAEKERFLEFSRVECTGCEGGRSFDAWASRSAGLRGYNAWEKKIGAMAVSERYIWKGAESDGVLEVVGEHQVGAFPCKQIRYTLTKRATREQAQRPGLFCFGRQNQFAGSDSWVEVF
jgi:hypothetical protein